ncbi:MAG: hypothetical protein ACR2NX_04280 [Chthoniobacterales bacterium]
MKKTLMLGSLALVLFSPLRDLWAQRVAYESFAGIPVGSGLVGSGTDATGWTDGGWNNGTDGRFQVVSPAPHLFFQLTGGPLIDGGDRAVELSTSPEPVPGNGLVAARSFAPQNTTLFVSYLVKPVSIGTGSDALGLRFYQGAESRGGFLLRTDASQNQQNFNLRWDPAAGGGFSLFGTVPLLYTGGTYLFVLRIRFPDTTTMMAVDLWVNPPAAFAENPVTSATSFSYNSTSPLTVDKVGLVISSADTGGPSSSAAFDELKIGYTWADVVPPGPQPPQPPGPTKFRNISTRARVGAGDDALIAGFIAGGQTQQRVIFRALGPSLAQYVSGALPNPTLSIYNQAGTLMGQNDDWWSSIQRQEIMDTGLAPSNNSESALILTLPPGAYTAVVRGVGNSQGLALVEVYDLD